MGSATRHIFVTVGTDHHRFDRLITWVESWVPQAGAEVEILVQHGFSRTPDYLPARFSLDVTELQSALRSADVIVTQGGPGGIMDARRVGIRPICVARSAGLGEAVDDHQIAFTRYLAGLGEVAEATSESELHRALDVGVLEPDSYRIDPAPPTPPQTIAAFARVVEQLIQRSPGGLRSHLPSFAHLRS